MITALRFAMAVLAVCGCGLPLQAQEVRVGVLFAIERSRGMFAAAPGENYGLRKGAAVMEQVFDEASASGLLPGGARVVPVVEGHGCDDWGAREKVLSLAESLVVEGRVSAMIIGGCAYLGDILSDIALANAIPVISLDRLPREVLSVDPQSMLIHMEDVATRQGQTLAHVLRARGARRVAVLSAGKLAETEIAAFIATFTADGGEIAALGSYGPDDAPITGELEKLAAAGGDALVIIRSRDGAMDDLVMAAFGSARIRQTFGSFAITYPWLFDTQQALRSMGADPRPVLATAQVLRDPEFAPDTDPALVMAMRPFENEQKLAHDAAALFVLALAKAGSVEAIGSALRDIANAPGEQILVGDLRRGLEIIAAGGEIDFVGATGFELLPDGNPAGNFDELELSGDEFLKVRSLPPE